MNTAEKSPPSPRRVRRILGWFIVVLAIMLCVPLAALAWLLGSESGLRALVAAAERFGGEAVVVERARGRVLGELDIARVEVSLPAMRLAIDDFSLAWRPRELLSRTLDVTHLRVAAIEYSAAPSEDSEPTALEQPPPVILPVDVRVREIVLGRLSLMPWREADDDTTGEARPDPLFELRDLDSAISSDGRVHRIEHLSLLTPFAELALDASLDAGQLPFQLALDGKLKGAHDGYDFGLAYRIRGDLETLHISLAGDGAGVDGEAELVVMPFEPVPLREVSAAIGVIDPAEFVAEAPTAALRINADLRAAAGDIWRLEGPVYVDNARPGSIDGNALPFSRLSARVDWSPELTRVSGLDLQLLGDGHVRGDAEWRPEAEGDGFGRVSALLELAGIRTEVLDTRLPPALVAGRVDAHGDAARQSATLELDVGEASLRAEGFFELPAEEGGAARFAAQGGLKRFNPAALVAESPPADLNLDFEAEGELAETPRIAAQWTFAPSRFDGRPLNGHGRLTLIGERVEEADVELVLAGNTVRAQGAWGRIDDVLAVRIDAPALDALGFGLAGRARAEANISGTRTEPSGDVTLFAEGLQMPGDVRVGGLNASGRLERGLDGPVSFALGVSGVGATGGDTWVEQASLVVDGTRRQHVIDFEVATPDEDRASLRLAGALLEGRTGADDGWRWRGDLAALESSGRVALSLQQAAPLQIAADRVRLEALRLDAGENGRVELAETEWTPARIIARGNLAGLQVVERRVPGRGPDGLTLGANWDIRLTDTANGELHVYRETGDFWIPGEMATRIGLEQLDLRADIRDNRVEARLDARGTELGEVDGRLAARLERQGESGWGLAPDGALEGEVRLDMPSIAWLSRLIEEETVLGGSLRAAVTLAGTPASPDASGRLEGSDLSVMLVEYGVELAGGELLAEFDRDRMRLSRFEFVSPNRVRPRDPRVPVDRFTQTPGSLRATGEVALDTGDGAFDFEADRMPILQRRDRWLLLSGEGRAVSTWTSLDLDAAFRTDAGYFELADTPPPSLSDDVVIVSDEPEREREGGMEVNADIRVSLGDQLYLSALGLETRLSGDLRLQMRPGDGLRATGSLSTVGGAFRGYGQNLTIQRGIINFQGPLDNPGLNVRALRTGLPVEAGIEVVGSARRPVIRLVSQPEVPDPEKLSWIVLGRAPSAGGGADLGLLLPAAEALLGGSGSGGGMTDQLSRSLGFDEFGIGQGELGSVSRRQTSQVVGGGSVAEDATVSGQVLTLGRRLSSDLFLSFEQSLGGAESLVKLSYQLSRRVSLVARGGTDNSADVYYTVSFR